MTKQQIQLKNLFTVNNEKNRQLRASEYAQVGLFPIIDQSSLFICGYSDKEELVRYDVPLIVFGDHSRIVKLITFPFIVGADGIQILKPEPEIEPVYLYYLISNAASRIGDYGYERHLKYLKSSLVNYDSNRTTQQKIVQILTTIDGQIDKTTALISQDMPSYKTLQQGMLRDLFTRGIDVTTGKLRSSSFKAPNLYKASPLGLIPKEWECVRLNELIDIDNIIDNRGKTPPTVMSDGIELIETASIGGAELYPDYTKITKYVSQSTYANWFRKYLEAEDILISTVGEHAGSAVILKEKRGIIAQNIVGLRVLAINSAYYTYHWFKTESFIRQAKQVIMNAAQPSLKVSDLLNFYVPRPNLNEQQTIAAHLLSIYNLIFIENKNLAKLNKLKQGLIIDNLA